MKTMLRKSTVGLFVGILGMTLFGGCSSYTPPGGPAKLALFSSEELVGESVEIMDEEGKIVTIVGRKPVATFPASLVVVRVQEPGYQSLTTGSYGSGRYSVVFDRDIEKEEDYDRLSNLVDIDQLSPLSRLLLSDNLQSEKDLRVAASRLSADMILIYTIDTKFYNIDKSTPLTVISLGFGPTINARVITSISALLMDAKTGYIYGTIEETAKEQRTTSAISTKNDCDKLRLKTERDAFEMFIDEFETMWKRVVQRNKG